MFKKRERQHVHFGGIVRKYGLVTLILVVMSVFMASTAYAKEDNWILQGEMKTLPTVNPVSVSSPLINSSFNTSGNLAISACIPIANPYVVSFVEKINWGNAFEGGAEYKLVWKAKSISGTATVDGHTLPADTWSPEYETKGKTLVWAGSTYNNIEFEYVKLYARDSFFSQYEVTAQWDFKGGSANDASGNGNNGTYIGTIPANIKGKTNEGLSLNGSSGMSVPASNSFCFGDQNFSVSLWYKSTEPGNYTLVDATKRVDGKKSGYYLGTFGTEFYAQVFLDGRYGIASVSNAIKYDGNWHHISIVYDKTLTYSLFIYSDGEILGFSAPKTSTVAGSSNSVPLFVGMSDGGYSGFKGVIDDVTIYKKALDYSEMSVISDASPDVTANAIKKDTVLDINANGNVLDYSQNSNHAIQADGNVPTFEKSKTEPMGKALQFNGKNGLVVPNSPSINFGTEDFSISCWFKTTNTNINNTILDKRDAVGTNWHGYHLSVYNGKDILLQMADDLKGWYNFRGSSPVKLNDGNWHFIAVTIDRDSTQGVKIYIDGQLRSSGNATERWGSIDSTANLLIGKHSDFASNNFIGAIDEVKLFKRVITEAEVKKVYGKKKWNVLLFLNGDNSLEGQQVPKLNDFELTGSTDDINVLVLLDRLENEELDLNQADWTGTRLYYVTKDQYSDYRHCSQLLKDYGELDMSDPKNLQDFISYCQTNYPAEKTLVSISDHGNGLTGISQDETSGNSVMSIAKVKQALTNARTKTNQKIDILLFDACLMQMSEIAYQFRNETDYIVGSEEESNGATLNDMKFYSEFAKNGSRSPEEVMGLFSQFCTQWTFSGIKTKDNAMSSFVTAFNNFSTLLAAKTDLTDIKAAYADSFKMYANRNYIDLINFADNVYAKTTDTNLKNSITALKTAYNNCIVFNKPFYDYSGKVNGLTIFFPTNIYALAFYENEYGYTDSGYDFLASTKWNEFLHVYYP
ncbi:LamG-like jellyroll fold domain-containing protein [Acetivibrio cellulolyticus]|uniref:LamG-like jellyroll fold domain-containing protein n=1 Tax=Acetivibrio cellulolyticus TaxID=35830 RepID=UPI0001E2C1B0|nr:LamG-like jellyroll fold domain-containing protein [Acetivibrio cellulolyticus]